MVLRLLMYTTREKRIQCILSRNRAQVKIYQQLLKNGVKVFQKLNGLHMMKMDYGTFLIVDIYLIQVQCQ